MATNTCCLSTTCVGKAHSWDLLCHDGQLGLLHVVLLIMLYCLAQHFRESKFLQIAVFESFVAIILQIHCLNHVHTAQVMYLYGHGIQYIPL